MAWLIDPRKWDDAWWAGLSPCAARVWDACLTGPFRTALPGLCKGVSASTLYDACVARIRREDRRISHAEFAEDLEELLAPDVDGRVHVFFDPATRVIRIPMAPAYNHADNPNVLSGWYRLWRDVPDCALKFDHIESLRLGVNFSYVDKRGGRPLAERWADTFGKPEEAYRASGTRLKTYVDLKEGGPDSGAPPQTELFGPRPNGRSKGRANGHSGGYAPAQRASSGAAEDDGELPPGVE